MTRSFSALICFLSGLVYLPFRVWAEGPFFIENRGQWYSDATHRCLISGAALFLRKDGYSHVLYDKSILESWHNGTSTPENNPLKMVHVKVTYGWLKHSEAILENLEETPYYENYFVGSDPAFWVSRARSFRRVHFESPDRKYRLEWLSGPGGLKYNLVLMPGFEPQHLFLHFEGAQSLAIDESGRLLVRTEGGYVREDRPRAWYADNPDEAIPCWYEMAEEGRVHFRFPESVDRRRSVVVDPVVWYGSYSGSTSDNFGFTATYDAQGNVFIAGNVFNVGYPVTVGVFQPAFAAGLNDVSITKMNATLTANLWSTYLGGNGAENPHSLVVNNYGDLFVMGTTGSANFPTTPGCFDNSFNGGSGMNVIYSFNYPQGCDIFISRIKSDGSQLLASTFVGGSGNDGVNLDNALDNNYADIARGEIDIDLFNNIYVASVTQSQNFPGVQNTFGPVFGGGGQDAVLFKMDNNLTTLIWAGYLGGSSADAAYSLSIEKTGHVLVSGGTSSANFPVTNVPGFSTYNGNVDGFVSRIKSDGTAILTSIYFGTPQFDQAYFVESGKSGDVYLFGQTTHTGTQLILNATYSVTGGGQFVSKLSPGMNTMIWSTQWGTTPGQINISPTAFLVDVCNKVYMCGWGGQVNQSYVPGSSTTGLPTTAGAFQTSTTGSDFYVMVMEENAAGLYYATFFGGPTSAEHVDGGTSRFNRKGEIYQAVCGGCGGWSDFPTSPGAWSATNNSTNCNNAVFKINFDFPTLLADFTVPPAQCAPATITFNNLSTNGITYQWNFGNGQTSAQTNPTVTYTSPGTYNVTLVAFNNTGNTCNAGDSIVKQVYIFGNSTQQQPPVYVCDNQPTQIGFPPSGDPSVTYQWIPATGLSSSSISNPIFDPLVGSTTYSVLISNSVCTDTLILPVVVQPFPNLSLNDTTVCAGPVPIGFPTVIPGATYVWSPASGLSDPNSANPVANLTQSSTYTVTVTLGNCSTTVSRTLNVISIGSFNTPDTTICRGDSFQVTDLPLNPGLTALWSPATGLSSATSLQPFANPLTTTTYTIIISNGQCSDTLTKTIQVIEFPAEAGNDTTICVGDAIVLGPASPLPFLSYNWSPSTGLSATDIPNPLASPASTTTYIVSTSLASNPQSCVHSDTVQVSVFAAPGGGILFTEYASCLGLSVKAEPNPPGGSGNYTWILPDGQTVQGPHVFIDVPFETTIQVGHEVQNGPCRDTVYSTFTAKPLDHYFGNIVMPNVFTPASSPTLNDCFAPIGLSECFDLLVYNRWGNLIFDSRELNKNCWDGKVWKSDQLASDGVYFYILDAFGRTWHGTVSLVR